MLFWLVLCLGFLLWVFPMFVSYSNEVTRESTYITQPELCMYNTADALFQPPGLVSPHASDTREFRGAGGGGERILAGPARDRQGLMT